MRTTDNFMRNDSIISLIIILKFINSANLVSWKGPFVTLLLRLHVTYESKEEA